MDGRRRRDAIERSAGENPFNRLAMAGRWVVAEKVEGEWRIFRHYETRAEAQKAIAADYRWKMIPPKY